MSDRAEGDRDPMRVVWTARLRLEPQVEAHAGVALGPLSEPSLYTFIPQDPPADVAAVSARFRRLSARRSPDGAELWLNWLMFERERGPSSPVGLIEATVPAAPAPERGTSVAYFVFSAHQRRGFAREGLSAVMTELEVHHGARWFTADIDVRNEASIRLVASLGFVRERVTERADFFKGSFSDEAHYRRLIPHRPRTVVHCPS